MKAVSLRMREDVGRLLQSQDQLTQSRFNPTEPKQKHETKEERKKTVREKELEGQQHQRKEEIRTIVRGRKVGECNNDSCMISIIYACETLIEECVS